MPRKYAGENQEDSHATSFEERMNLEEPAETKAWRYLKACQDTLEVIDVREEASYQRQDIDFLWVRRFGTHEYPMYTVEVNAQHDLNAVFVETVDDAGTEQDGVLWRARADYFCYVSITDSFALVFPREHFWQWYIAHRDMYPQHDIEQKDYYGHTHEQRGSSIPRMEILVGVSGAFQIEIDTDLPPGLFTVLRQWINRLQTDTYLWRIAIVCITTGIILSIARALL